MSLSRLPLPSFSIVLTRPDESGAPVELLNLKDFQRASRRELHLNLQPKDEDPLMKTIDTRFSGSLTYDVDYAVRFFPSPFLNWNLTTVNLGRKEGCAPSDFCQHILCTFGFLSCHRVGRRGRCSFYCLLDVHQRSRPQQRVRSRQ
ncbi:hypothetical protein FA13DRAFT_646172 [Coprinellus micaceus]|uniref:Uncharacterized protein n=1 Tax=Coprinellus micaceus TaxID=71717 RepID=A0A4Y7T665_COPMI|nr:hypothetical protein FA13DRAFT_646172 [Coprinellus micaceus]